MLCHYYQRTGYPTPQQVKHSLVNCEKFRRLLGPNQLPLPAEITVELTKPGAVRPELFRLTRNPPFPPLQADLPGLRLNTD